MNPFRRSSSPFSIEIKDKGEEFAPFHIKIYPFRLILFVRDVITTVEALIMPPLVKSNTPWAFHRINMVCPKLVTANLSQQNKRAASYSAAWLLVAVEDLSETISDQVKVYKF